MTSDEAKPKRARKPAPPPPERKARGFLRAGDLTPAALKTAGGKRGFAELRLLTEWRAVVGEALARICRPVKVTYGRSGPGLGATLVITAEGARAPEIDIQKDLIIGRVNALYGYRAVSRLAIDQSRAPMVAKSAAGFADEPVDWTGPPPKPVEGVKDETLALALARLGANVSAKARAKTDQPEKTGPDTEHGSTR